MPIKMSTSPEGRPANSGISPTGELADKLRNGQLTPLDVMQDNMRCYSQLADRLSELLALALREKPHTKAKHRASIGRLSREQRRSDLRLARVAQTIVQLRKKAQACAIDAMPYTQPKLKANPRGPACEPQIKIEYASDPEK